MNINKIKLVTGGAGFIGSHLTYDLVARGYRVRVLDDLSTGNLRNLDNILPEIEFVTGSICDHDVVSQAMNDVDVVFHLAAIPSVQRSFETPAEVIGTNIGGTATVFDAASEAVVERVVFASSSSVYGDSETLPKIESMSPNPLSIYAMSKLSSEQTAKIFNELYGLSVICLRYFNVFGARQNPDSEYAAVIPKFIEAILDDQRPTIYGTGEQSRDFTHVSSVVRANLFAADADVDFDILNIARGERITLLDLIDVINKIAGTSIPPMFAPARAGDVMHSQADIERARAVIGYEPDNDFHKHLTETIDYYEREKKTTGGAV